MDASIYQIPGDNAITLSDELAREIKSRFQKDRDNRFKLFLLSHGIRQKYLDPITNEYPKEFHEWYEASGVSKLFGKLSNFSKYAAAGEVIEYVATKTRMPDEELAKLPVSLRALYEISLILKLDEEVFKACLHFTPTRKTLDAPKHEWKTKDTDPLIHPEASSLELASWRKRWETPIKQKEEDKFRRNVKLLTVSVSQDLFAFDESGKTGVVDMEQVQDLLTQIQALFSKSNEKQFKLETQIERITEKYASEKEKADPANALKSLKKSRADDYK